MQPFWSVALTVIGNAPAALLVPESTPVAEFIVMPAGNVPITDHAIVPTPPVCVNCSLNAAPAVPDAFTGFVTVIVGQVMFRL